MPLEFNKISEIYTDEKLHFCYISFNNLRAPKPLTLDINSEFRN